MTGRTFGRLFVFDLFNSINRQAYWECVCLCGGICLVRGDSLRNGAIQSCGCLMKGLAIARATRHNKHNTRTYVAWRAMKARCNNENGPRYYRYGGRGISYCAEWEFFENFYSDMGNKPKNRSLDRINNDGNYDKENCRWATHKQQMNNTSRNKKGKLI